MIVLGDMIEAALYSAIAPLVLLLVSSVWVYPAALEEVVKWGILRLRSQEEAIKIADGAIVGLVFGLSETPLYSVNAWSGGQWGPMITRLALTVPMHIMTASVLAWGIKNKLVWIVLPCAMIVHTLFNYYVSRLP